MHCEPAPSKPGHSLTLPSHSLNIVHALHCTLGSTGTPAAMCILMNGSSGAAPQTVLGDVSCCTVTCYITYCLVLDSIQKNEQTHTIICHTVQCAVHTAPNAPVHAVSSELVLHTQHCLPWILQQLLPLEDLALSTSDRFTCHLQPAWSPRMCHEVKHAAATLLTQAHPMVTMVPTHSARMKV